MPHVQTVHIGVGDIGLVDPHGTIVRLSQLPPIQVLVLMRHRH